MDQYSIFQIVTKCYSKLTQRIIWMGKRGTLLSDYLKSILQPLRFKW